MVGWKLGYIASDHRASGEPDRLVGPVWRSQCAQITEHDSPVEMPIFASGLTAVEAKLILRLSHDLPAHETEWTAEEVAHFDPELLVGVEVASSPIPDINSFGPTVIAADFGNNNLPGGMDDGMATALNVLARRLQPVHAGTVLATGAITGIHPIGPGQHCRVEVRADRRSSSGPWTLHVPPADHPAIGGRQPGRPAVPAAATAPRPRAPAIRVTIEAGSPEMSGGITITGHGAA